MSEIVAFYNNLNVLITGGTGLLGQLLVEKLLRVCTDIEGIYLILRSKNGKSALERITEAFKEPLYEKLKKAYPDFSKKIHVLEGDCSELNLGLNNLSRQILIEKVNVVFHCAATLNMEAKLEDAVNTNVRGFHELLALCREMNNLKSMTFVSTAYSNCIQQVIEEKFYKPPLKPDTIMTLAHELGGDVLHSMTDKLIDKWPNTYCYSKVIAEDLVYENVGSLPVCLFRPSIVMPTYSEPVAGWTCNLYGPIGFFVATGLGILRTSLCNPHGKIDFIPADFCTNALICTAWKTHKKFKLNSNITHLPVYNYSGGEHRNITIQNMADYAMEYEYPFKNALWVTDVTLTNNRIYYAFLQIFLHYIPGYIVDFYCILSGKKPRLIKAYGKISKMTKVLNFFSCNDWNIVNDNTHKLWNSLNKIDKNLFPFDIAMVDYKKYLTGCATGIKLYILKETLDNVEEERKMYQRLVKMDKSLKAVLLVLFVAFVVKILFVCFTI